MLTPHKHKLIVEFESGLTTQQELDLLLQGHLANYTNDIFYVDPKAGTKINKVSLVGVSKDEVSNEDG